MIRRRRTDFLSGAGVPGFDGNCVSGRLEEEVAPNLKSISVQRYLKNVIGGERINE